MQLDVEDPIFSQSPATRPRKDSNDSSASETILSVLAREDEADIDDDSSSCGHPSFTDGETENVDNSDLSTGKDSGIDSSNGSEEDFTIPTEELTQKIIKQVEFYFSDANILKDSFLLKHVRRNKEGYVSLKLMASFRKVKSLTKNWKVVAYSLRQSEKLEVNSEGTKVRRRDPIPEYDETTPSRTVVAFNLPFEKSTIAIENVGELFSRCGEITLIRILRPGGAVPTDVKRFIHKHPEIGSSICAVVEFEKHEGAQRAVDMDSKNSDWRSLHVLPLAQKGQQTKDVSSALCGGNNKASQNQEGKTKKKKGKQQKRVVELRTDSESPVVSSCSENEQNSPRPRRRTGFSVTCAMTSTPLLPQDCSARRPSIGSPTVRSTPNSSPVGSRKTQNNKAVPNRQKSHSQGDVTAPIGVSPWVQKRMLAAKGSSLSESSSGLIDVIRQPRGPDGTKGFHWDRSKQRTMSAPMSLMVTAY